MENYDFDPTRAMKQMMVQGLNFPLGTIRMYGRKSTPQERGAVVCRSVRQQMEVNRKTCLEWGLPARAEDEMCEPQGFGGDLMPTGATIQLAVGDTADNGRTRAVLGELLTQIVHDGVRCVVVYSEDRLWRSSKLCAALLEFFAKWDVHLFDCNGPIDFRSVEGFSAVVQRAIAAEAMRKLCSRNAKRGHKSGREEGRLQIGADCLGFRSGGRYSGTVVPQLDEIALAVRIHGMYNDGEGDGPMSPQKISETLMREGIAWPADLQAKTSVRRTEHTARLVYPWQVRKVLTDVRLQGMQTHGGRNWPCDAFLVDGHPAVPPQLWARTQAKLEDAKVAPNSSRERHALAGIMRCGVCGQGMACRKITVKTKAGDYKEWYWQAYKNEAWCWCDHGLPSFRAARMDDFLSQALWPLMRAQVASRRSAGESNAAAAALRDVRARQAAKAEELSELRRKARKELRDNLDLVAELDQEIRGEIQALAAEEALHQAEVNASEAAVPHLEDWDDASESARRDAVRATIRWMAVVPIDSPRVRDQWGRLVPGMVLGKILICTVWNSLITAVVVREWCDDSSKRRLVGLRLAEMDECYASVMDLPDVESFKAGLTRSYAGKKIGYDPVRHLPGYEAGVAPPASVLHPILGAAA